MMPRSTRKLRFAYSTQLVIASGKASLYHQLGVIAQNQRRFDEAEANYRKALDIKLEFGDRHSAANTYHQLGRLAQEQRRFGTPKPTTDKPSTST